MKNKLFTGVMPAFPTFVDENSAFLPKAAEKVIDLEMPSGIKGFYVNGATGEGPVLPEKTRMENIELCTAKLKGRGVVINHVGAADTQEAFRLAKHAGQIGCDAISSVLPYFFFKYDVDDVLDYFKRLADISGLPVLLYANGLMTIDPLSFMRKAINIDGVIGLKYTMFDYYTMHRICELNGGDINVINGPDEMLLCGLAMGADGGIGSTYNIMPTRYVAIYEAMKRGDLETAKKVQYSVNRVIEVLHVYDCISAIKAVFELKGIDCGSRAYPFRELTAEQKKDLKADLAKAGLDIDAE